MISPVASVQSVGQSWPVLAVHDSVAAIAQQPVYQRSLSKSLWSYLWSWLDRVVDVLFDTFRGSSSGRAVTIGLLVIVGVLIAARIAVAVRAARQDGVGGDTARRGSVVTDSLRDAERLATAGLFTEAAHALLAALLATLASRGEVRLHPSKTAGDYARELARRGSHAHGGFQSFRRRYDGAIYGLGSCDAEQYQALLQAARPLLAAHRAA